MVTRLLAPALLGLFMAVAPVAAGAGLEGTISAGASVRPPSELSVAVDDWICGDNGTTADPRLVIGSDGGLANVVVTALGIIGAPAYAAAGERVIDQKGCVFTPHVTVVAPGEPVEVRNGDDILHTFRTTARENRNINKAQIRGASDRVVFERPENIRVLCDVHYWMSAVIAVAPHAHVAVSDANGRFRIEGLEPGSYRLQLWHEVLGTREAEAVVGPAPFRFTWE